MPNPDAQFIAKLQATFAVEAEELLQTISSMLLELEKVPASLPLAEPAVKIVENVYREAHTLKGASRAVNLPDIEAVCQQLEEVFSSWKRRQSTPTPDTFDSLHKSLDQIRSLLFSNKSLTEQASSGPAQTNEPDHLSQPQPASIPTDIQPPATIPTETQPADTPRTAGDETVRISIEKLDSHLLQAEDMLILKSTASGRAAELRQAMVHAEHFQHQWSKVSSEARTLRQLLDHNASNAPGISTHLLDFLQWNSEFVRSMQNKLQELSIKAQQDHHDLVKRVDDLLETSKKLLMLPFSTLANPLSKLVRDLCRDQNKQADLVIQGAELEIDKRILDEMKGGLIHILRNCVDHGIETPQRRQQLGKPQRATITLAAAPVNGSKVEITVADDGTGIDLLRVKASAVEHGILSESQAKTISDPEAARLIFKSDVSTSPAVTAISGRGLGMAIVLSKIEKLAGQISIQTRPDAGTTLRMILPLTMSTFRGIVIAVADRMFVVPLAHIQSVLRVRVKDIQSVENRQVISLHGQTLSLVRLADILDLPSAPSVAANDFAPVVILRFAQEQIALAVDQVLHEEEVLVKPLRKPLMRVRNIAGATLLASGKVAPVLNIADLMQSARLSGGKPAPIAQTDSPAHPPSKRVLIAEDSITSRMLLKGIMEAAGFSVTTAVDGADAFAALRENEFDLLISDVEMPRMNGFDLTSRVRADRRLAELPVVLITALESREQRERGMDAGASAYVIKSSFDQQNLLEVVRRLI